jgi:hypothetical protein
VPNKFTGELKEAILAGVNGSNKQGVAGFVLDLSLNTPTSAAALLGRVDEFGSDEIFGIPRLNQA